MIKLSADYTVQKQLMNKISSYQGRKTFLLSYPRSGNTWLRYCLEYLTGRPSFAHNYLQARMNQPLGWYAGFDIDCNRPPIEKVHSRSAMENSGTRFDDLLIFIVRNPKEALTRHQNKEITLQALAAQQNPTDKVGSTYVYFDNLKLYDCWNPENRLLIYYEDLMADPEQTLIVILQFLQEPIDQLDDFMKQYDEHKRKAISIYKKYQKESKTEGNDLLFHSKKITSEHRQQVDSWIAQLYPDLWQKYLMDRYSGRKSCL